MFKVVIGVAVVLNFLVLMNTCEGTRREKRNARPEIIEQNKKAKALALAEKQNKEAIELAEKQKNEAIELAERQRNEALQLEEHKKQEARMFQSFQGGYRMLSGKMEWKDGSETVTYLVVINFFVTNADAFEPNQLRAILYVFDTKNLRELAVYRAKTSIKDKVVAMELESVEPSTIFGFLYYAGNVTRFFKKAFLTIDTDGKVGASVVDISDNKWPLKLGKVDASSVAQLLGKWQGVFPDKSRGSLSVEEKDTEFSGEMNYVNSGNKCKGKLKGLVLNDSQLLLVIGGVDGPSICFPQVVIRIKSGDGGISGILYDDSRQFPEEFKFHR